jgi:hypothetical protein
MQDTLPTIASLVAIVSTLAVLWRSSRSRNLSILAYAAGFAGGLLVLAGSLDRRVPIPLIGVGFLLAVAATYVWLFRRERGRGGGALDALSIQYQARLSRFERSFSLLMAAALVTLAWFSPDIGWIYRAGISIFAAGGLYMGIIGRPPRGATRDA